MAPAFTKPSLIDKSEAPADDDVMDDADGGGESSDPLVQAAGVISSAVQDGDNEALADALRSFITLSQDSEGPMGPDAGGPPPKKPKLVIAVGDARK